jgi:hypothetical protein
MFIKKPFIEILNGFLHFCILKKYSLSLLRDENFSYLNGSNGVSKNPSFHTDFKNVNLIFMKIAPKKIASLLGFGNHFERSLRH